MNGDRHGGTGVLDQFGSFAMGHCRTRTAVDFGQNITATQFATHGHLIHTRPSTSINAISLTYLDPHHPFNRFQRLPVINPVKSYF
jgi:hypothetical protein